MKLLAVILIFLCALADFFIDRADAAPSSPKIVNLGEPLARYVKESSNLDADAKVRLFQKIVVKPQEAAFNKLVFRGEPSTKYLQGSLPKAETTFPAGVTLAKEFGPLIASTLAEYKKSFPDADYGYTVLLLPSFTFDGRADELDDGTIIVAFGLDRLSRYKKEDLKIVVAHEMFHALQMQTFKAKTKKSMLLTTVWHEVWVEGLATYASGVITGLKSANGVLGKKNIDGCKADLPKEKATLLANFDKKTADVAELMDRWFGGHQFAYCLGYVAIQEIAKGQSLATLLNWELTPTTRSKLYERIDGMKSVSE